MRIGDEEKHTDNECLDVYGERTVISAIVLSLSGRKF